MIGNRGVGGDLTYPDSVLNDYRFLLELDQIIGARRVEIFIPNSLNALYYFCVSHPGVERISFVDEGRLTKHFLDGGFTKPTHPLSHALIATYCAVYWLPGSTRGHLYRALAGLLHRTIGRTYKQRLRAYPYRTIERRWKRGVVLSHIDPETLVEGVEVVDLTKGVDAPIDCASSACLFVHPMDAATPDQIARISEAIDRETTDYVRGLIRPHPLFSNFPTRLQALQVELAKLGKSWEVVELSGKYEASVELYARGVQLFFVHRSSSVGDTVRAFPMYFSNLKLVEIRT